MKRLYNILLFLALSSVAQFINAAHINFSDFQSSSIVSALPGTAFSVAQNDFAALPSVTGYSNYSVTNNLMVFVDHTYSTYIGSAYSYTVKLELKTWDANKTLTTQAIELPVEYDPNANPGISFKDRSIFKFTGAHKIEVKILDIKNNVSGLWGVSNPEDNFIVKANIDIERIYDFTPTAVTLTSNTPYNLNANAGDDELIINWPSISGAEEYDLEWTYIDDYSSSGSNVPKPLSSVNWDFRNNATRITTAQTNYKLSLIYERGYIVFRVRGVGKSQSNPNQQIFGTWNISDNGTMTSLTSGSYYRVLNHNGNLNWQYSSVFAEEGKKKEVVGYYDGSLRGRQTVTKTNSDNTAIVGESIYDQVGRKAIDILPVPMQSPAIDYYPNLSLNMSGNKYGWTDFDTDAQPCSTSTAGMKNTVGASQYYSTNNPDRTGMNANIPDAANFPFSQIEYEPDNTGRIRRQGGVGANHQLNSGHETKYYYGQPTQIELDRLFGNEVGYASHYKKNMVIDPNGQISISYLDQEGRVIATALSGQKPTNVDQLSSYPTSPAILNAGLLSNVDNSTVSKQNSISLDYSSIDYNTQLLVSEPGDYTFNYDVSKETFTYNCNGNAICFDCSYDLEITITDECGIILYTDKASIGSPVPDLSCGNVMVFHSAGKTFPFTVNLGIGKYQVAKSLKINQSAYEYYLSKYLDGTVNTCLTPFSQFLNEEKAKLDYSGCELTCDQCVASLGTVDDYVLSGKGSEADWQTEYDKCMKPCQGTSLCEQTLHMMTEDMKPGGQYAQWYDQTTESMDVSLFPLSIFNPNNILPDQNKVYTDPDAAFWKNPKIEVRDNTGTFSFISGFFEEDGITRSTIEVVKLIDGSLFPKADNYFTIGTKTYCYPEKLQNVRDFISFYKSSWAKSLVYYHPEYCYNKWCIINISSSFKPYDKNSEDFDALINDISTYADAVTAGYTSGINNIANADPFFNSAPNGTAYKTAMTNKLANWDGTGRNAQAVSTIAARAPHWYGTNIPTGTDVWGSGSSDEQNKAWNTYKSFYLSYKQELMKQSADAWVTNSSNCGRGSNGCIGEGNFNPFPSMTTAILSGTTDPCAMSTYVYYKNKVRRFDLTASTNVHVDLEKARFNNSYYKGICPFDENFFGILGEMALAGNLKILHTLTSHENFTPIFHQTLMGNPASLPTTFIEWNWQPAGGTAINELYVNLSNGTNSVAPCSTLWAPVHLQLPTGKDWVLATQLSNFKVSESSSAIKKFTCSALISGQWYPVQGETCLPIGNCSFGDDCRNTEYATSLNNLLGAIAKNGQLTSASVINLESSYPTHLTRHIRNNVTPTGSNLQYSYPTAGQMKIYEATNPAGGIIINFTAYDDPAFNSSLLNTILYFTDWKYIDNTIKTGFTVKGWYLSGGNLKSVTITGNVNKGILATCIDPVPMVCDNLEYRATVDFEALMKDIIQLHPTTSQDLLKFNNYTGLLESYIGKGNTILLPPTYSDHDISMTIEIRDPNAANNLLSQCSIKLYRQYQSLKNPFDPAIGFQNAVDLGLLNADLKTYQSGGARSFTTVLKFANGHVEEVRGTVSCLPLYRCDKCERETLNGGGVYDPGTDTCNEYKYYVQELKNFNQNYPGANIPTISYSSSFPCGCVDGYLAYLRLLRFNRDLKFAPPVYPYGQSYLLDLTAFNLGGCKLDASDECCVANLVGTPPTKQFNMSDSRAKLIVDLANMINTTFTANPTSWWTGSFSVNPNQFDCVPDEDCFCPAKYAEYLGRWVNFNNAYNPWPGPPPFMPITYTEFKSKGCKGGDCWYEYNYYNKLYTQRGGTPEAWDPTVDCNCYVRAARFKALTNSASVKKYCSLASPVFVSPNSYSGVDFGASSLSIRKKTLNSREYKTRLFSQCEKREVPALIDYNNGCSEWLDKIAYGNAEIRYKEYLKAQAALFHKSYMDKCMGAVESFTMQYPIRDYHYTLYYYDQAGNLVRTVPPAGVKIISDPSTLAEVNTDRITSSRKVFTSHILSTVYEYNSLNQLVKQSVPDHDKMDKWYVKGSNGIPTGFVASDIHFSDVNLGYMVGNLNVSGSNGDAIILRTEDGGVNWKRVDDIRSSDITKSAMANSTVGYAIGKGGLFLKTTDAGQNWKIVPLNNSITADLNDLIVRTNGANFEGVVVGNSGFSSTFIDNSSAITWSTKTLPAGYTTWNIISASFKETVTGLGYAIADLNGSSQLLVCNTFSGAWSILPMNGKTRASDIGTIYMYSSTEGFAAGIDGGLLKTTDAGINWTMIPTGKSFQFKKLYFNSALLGMALADDGKLYKTADGGFTWADASTVGFYRDFNFYDITNGLGYGVGNNGLFSRLTVNSTTTKVDKVKYPQNITGNFTTVAALTTGIDGIVGGENGAIYRLITATTNLTFDDITTAAVSGKTFTKSYLYSTTIGSLITSDGILWRVNIGGTIANYTGTFTDISSSNQFTDFSRTGSTLYCLSNGPTFKTVKAYSATNPTSSITSITYTPQTGDGTMNAVWAIATNNLILAGNSGTLHKYVSPTWTYNSKNCTPHTLTKVFASPGLNNVIVAGTDGLMLSSTNNAADFTTVPTGTANRINTIASNTLNNYWIGTDKGKILNVLPGGSVVAYSGFQNANIQSIAIIGSSDIVALAQGLSAGFYRTVNGGTTWNYISSLSASSASTLWQSALILGNEVVLTGSQGQIAGYNYNTNIWNKKLLYAPVLNDLYINKNGIGMVVGNAGASLRTDNRGYTWYYNGQLAQSGSTYVNLNKVYIDNAATPTATIIGASAFAKTMNTNTTSAVNITLTGISGTPNLKGLAVNEKGTCLIAGGYQVFRKLSSGTWSLIHTGGASEVYNDIETQGDNALIIGNSKLVKRSTNINDVSPGFATVSISGTVPASDFQALEMYDMSRAYIAGTNGVVLKTVDWGVTWNQKYSDVNNTNTSTSLNVLAVNKRDHLVFAGAGNYGREVTDQADFASAVFYYDRLGRMVVSQNTKQYNKATKAYSYTLYDALGRITEVGEKANNTLVETTYSGKQIDDLLLANWIASGANNTRTEVTATYYDNQFSGVSTGVITQNNLRKRVASITYEDVYDANANTYQHASHFTYDVHGNVDHLVQDIPALAGISQQYKHIYYNFDLISGKVNQVDYNPGSLDEYHHKYTYDADNRITEVYTSRDGQVWDRDATYQYYKHGPLARTEIGDLKVQGLDYFYTIHGWIKGVNSNTMNETRDPGRDGDLSLAGNTHSAVAKDAFGYSLGYFQGDFNPIGSFTMSQKAVAETASSDMMAARTDLWNGNISSMVTCLPKAVDYSSSKTITPEAFGNAYKYDQLNRLLSSRTFTNVNYGTNAWQSGGGTNPQAFATDYTYDAMGNILTQKRNGAGIAGAPQALDDLTYNYQTNSNGLMNNRLYLVNDNVTNTNYTDDIDDQGTFNNTTSTINTANNYGYDELGNLVRDNQEEIANIEWTVYGKIKKVTRTGGSTKPDLEFGYDAMGTRLWKKVKPKPLNVATEKIYYYLRDAQGKEMARYSQYTHTTNGLTYEVQEHAVYGSSRTGIDNTVQTLYTNGAVATVNTTCNYRQLGMKSYELSNHLGNVLVTVSDKKVYKNLAGNIYFEAEITNISDYYPFGSGISTRSYSSGAYRYGFNGKEKDEETNCYDYGFRIYNSGLGKFLSVDPLFSSYPWYTPYQFAGNLPIAAIDLDGMEECLVNTYGKFGVTVMYSVTFLQVRYRFSEVTNQCVGISRSYFAKYQIDPSEAKEAFKTKDKNAGVCYINLLSDANIRNSCNYVISKSYAKGSTYSELDEKGNTITKTRSEEHTERVFSLVSEKATIKFDTDVSTVDNAVKNMTQEAKNSMQVFAVTLLMNPQLGLNVTGYADAQGTKDAKGNLLTGNSLSVAIQRNQILSENRAKALKQYVGEYLAEQKCTPEEIQSVMNRIYTTGAGTRYSDDDGLDGSNPGNRTANGVICSADGKPIEQCTINEVLNQMGSTFEECNTAEKR